MKKIKLVVGKFAIAEVDELKNIKFTFKVFRMQIFHLKSKWQNYINLNINVKTKGKICLALVLKQTPNKVSKSFIYKKQVFMNWFILTQLLVIITT